MRAQIQETYTVAFDDIDRDSCLSMNALAKYVQNISIHQGTELDITSYNNEENKTGYYWILSRVKYILDKEVNWQEQFSLKTYLSGIDKLFVMRECDIEDYSGRHIGHVIGSYILMDTIKNRPIKVSSMKESFREQIDFPYSGQKLDKLHLPKTVRAEEIRKAYYSDLDINGHMNNVCYIRWIVDILPIELLKEKRVCSLQINYNASIMYNDEVRVIMGIPP